MTDTTQPREQAIPIPVNAISQILAEVMDSANKNGANSISMPDEYVAVAHFVAYPEQYLTRQAAPEAPVQMILHCPKCQLQHVDAPDERTEGWVNPPHKSHLCHGCGHIWRPADVPTEGVKAIQTRGKNDAPEAPALTDAELDDLASTYFAEEWAQKHVKNAIHDAFVIARRAPATTAATTASAMLVDNLRRTLGNIRDATKLADVRSLANLGLGFLDTQSEAATASASAEEVAAANAKCDGCWGECGKCALDLLPKSIRAPAPSRDAAPILQVQQVGFPSAWCDVSQAEFDACSTEKRIVHAGAELIGWLPEAVVKQLRLPAGTGGGGAFLSGVNSHIYRQETHGCIAIFRAAQAASQEADDLREKLARAEESVSQYQQNVCELAEELRSVRAAQAAHAGADAERLDWLEHMTVNVRVSLRYGSRDLFWASPDDQGDYHDPSNIRAQIDKARAAMSASTKQGQKP